MTELSLQLIAQKYLSLLRRTESLCVSYKKAVKLVGGEKRLERLMLEGKVRYSKPEGSTNTMWRFNLADIIKNVKPLTEGAEVCEFFASENLI